MGGENRGKQFENAVRKAFEKWENVSIDRLYDQTTGYKGSCNICDFIVYYNPMQIYIECKSVHGNTLNFNNISDNQWNGLLKKSHIPGVEAGVMVWFIDMDITVYVPIQELKLHRAKGVKSLNIKDLKNYNYIVIPGVKKRIFFDYDMDIFLWKLKYKDWD